MRVYIESTIASYLVARPARDLRQAGRQQVTQDWWERRRDRHELFASQVVLDEVARGDAEAARLRLAVLRDVPLLGLTDEAKDLARSILASGLLPAVADRDATHIAVATVHEMDVLLSWNFRHIANAVIEVGLRRLVGPAGYSLPIICTPEEMMESDDESND